MHIAPDFLGKNYVWNCVDIRGFLVLFLVIIFKKITKRIQSFDTIHIFAAIKLYNPPKLIYNVLTMRRILCRILISERKL